MRIQYFVEVAKCENFSEAARTLFTSQPNLSKQISLMEQELGFPLFQRVGKTIHLTQAGQYLYARFKDLPSYTAQAITHARALSRGDVGSLTVGILEGQELNANIAGRLEEFRSRYPDVAVEMERESFSNLRRSLDNCRCDIILTLSFELEEEPGVCSAVVMAQEGAIAISRSHPLSAKEDLTLADLKDEDFVAISPDESPAGYDHLFRECAGVGFQPRVVRQAGSLESLLLCVETGIGIALLDGNNRLAHSENVRIVPVPGASDANLVAVWHEDNHNPAVLRAVECLRECGG